MSHHEADFSLQTLIAKFSGLRHSKILKTGVKSPGKPNVATTQYIGSWSSFKYFLCIVSGIYVKCINAIFEYSVQVAKHWGYNLNCLSEN